MTEKQPEMPKSYWKCSACGYTLKALEPPEACPSCHKKCEFSNVTCYAPECNFTGVDPRLG